jgi:aspartate/methionine/tyrosine aminotransferase
LSRGPVVGRAKLTAVRIADFKLERFFARWEFVARFLLGSSDAESFRVDELLSFADVESRALWDGLRLGYTESPGHPLLRGEIAALYSGLTADDVLVFAGAEEAIFAFSNVSLGPGDHVIVTWPAYQSLVETARAVGADVSLLRLRHSSGWALDVDEVASLLRPTTAAVIVNAPHNPTGMLPDRSVFDALVALCERRGVRLFVDEVYRYGEFLDVDRLPGACEATVSGVSLGALSKPFGLAGVRIGWIATRDRALLGRLSAFKDYLTICNSAPSEVLGIMALRAKDRLLSRNRGIVSSNLALLDAFFARRGDLFEWVRPRAGLVAFPRLLGSVSIDDFASRLVEEAGVMILPECVFDHTGNHFRIGFGRKNMPEALAHFEEFVQRALVG